jgi:tRNA 2-thiocytidine biosynthesis protein TtcA
MSRLEKQLYAQMKSTCERYELLRDGDRVMIAMSGGKDSYTLFHLLTRLVPRLPFRVELVAVHLDQVQPGYDGDGLRRYLEASGWPFEILREDTYSVVTTHVRGGTYCSLCSRLRRGILYTAAERLACTKIALGHHRDDSLETFLLNLFYSGKLQAMPASYRTDDDRFDVIRPLVECARRARHRRARGRGRVRDHSVQPVRLAGQPPP